MGRWNTLRCLRRFFANVRGDTLVEALAALLIAALGAAALATMVMVAVSASTTSKAAIDSSYRSESGLAAMSDRTSAGTLSISGGGLGNSFSVALDVYVDGGFMRYEPSTGGGGNS